ncbi:MAG: flagellar basal-body rod protein FlgF [Peptococcaceae bacterium]|nr:flagellar basal-body rod protein FlgF [Peptococcaceae bacterium]
MIRSLYSGVSGMKNHQIRMDTIGNNIANVNTTGFKSSRTNFQDTLYQMLRPASASSGGNLGGINANQVGLGMTVSSITNNMGQGALQATGRALDLAIDGNGWFVVSPDGGTTVYYTREGIFYIDNAGDLVNSNGYKVLDTGGSAINFGTAGVATLNIARDGTITAKDLSGNDITVSGAIGLAMFPNQDGLERVGQNLFKESPTSGAPIDTFGTAGSGGYGTINSGYLEMSNVDLTEEFTSMITTQRGYQASARTITTSDQMLQELLEIKR